MAKLKYTKLDSPEFRELQGKWYAKLAKDGFDDIELTHEGRSLPDTSYLKQHAGRFRQAKRRGTIGKNQDWYRLASQWVWERDHSRDNLPWMHRGWELLANGETCKDAWARLRQEYPGCVISKPRWVKWRREEEQRMLYAYRPRIVTAEAGETVYIKATLLEPTEDYTWDAELPSGRTIELIEDDMTYVK